MVNFASTPRRSTDPSDPDRVHATEGGGAGQRHGRSSGDGEVILSTTTRRELVKEVATLRRRLHAYEAQEKALLVVEEAASGEASNVP